MTKGRFDTLVREVLDCTYQEATVMVDRAYKWLSYAPQSRIEGRDIVRAIRQIKV